jgi:glycosyltransferase involved in cell wall biosynthesis
MTIAPARTLRALHLMGRAPDFQTQRAVEALTRNAVPHVPKALIGPGGRWLNRFTAFLGLRREIEALDVIHCWDEQALTLAAIVGVKRIIYSPQSMPRKAGIRWLRAIMGYRDVQVVCPSTTIRRLLLARGVPLERCHLIRPGVDFSRIRSQKDQAMRSALGIGADDFVVLAPGESTDAANHFLGVWATSIVNALDERWRFLLWGRGPRASYVARLAHRFDQQRLIIVAEEKLGREVDFEALLPVADAAIVTAAAPVAALPIAECMAAALPIVSTVTPAVAELLEDRHTALLVPEAKVRRLAEKLLALREDVGLRRQIADTARTEAFELWSLTRFQQRWRSFYEQLERGGKIEVEM